jgi:hypothetical protein
VGETIWPSLPEGTRDPGEEQKRPGWQLRYPGIDVQVATANSIVDGEAQEESLLPAPTIDDKEREKQAEEEKEIEEESLPAPKFEACFADNAKSRVLPVPKGSGVGGSSIMGLGGKKPSDMEPIKCQRLCRKYDFMALQTVDDETFCYCGHSPGKAKRLSNEECNRPCAGNPAAMCGGPLKASVYNLNPENRCYDGLANLDGAKKPWHRYEKCGTCFNHNPMLQEKWQEWGERLLSTKFAACMSCGPEHAFVLLDAEKQIGFCRRFNPAVDAEETYTYPYFAHWDGVPSFAHTKMVRKYVIPKTRKGKARAVCRLWKQLKCAVSKAADTKIWTKPTSKSKVVPRLLECSSSKTVKCEKVCVSSDANGRCGEGATEVEADHDDGLRGSLGQQEEGLSGSYCCYDRCQIPREHELYKEDGSFWCKDHIVGL